MGLLLLFFLISICFSFLCSIWEAVLLSITPSYVNKSIQEGKSIGKLLQLYKKDIDKPLSAILTLNTIAHTVGAIGVGAQAGELYGSHAIDLGFTSITYESIVAGGMTMAILILSEIIPKTIGANMWKPLVPFTIRSIRILLLVLGPFVWLSQFITKSLKKEKDRSVLSRSDFSVLAMAGVESGALDKSESKIISNLLQLDKLLIKDIMTPRSVVVMANEATSIKDFYQKNKPLAFSRVPTYHDKPDNITGVILKDEVLEEMAEGHNEKTLADIRRDILFVNDSDAITKLLDTFVKKQLHIAIVTDHYGSVVGLVTMEDIFETLLGLEIVDEYDKIEDLQKYARKQWEERARRQGRIK